MEKYEVLPPSPGKHNMENYEEFCKNFSWEDVEKEFSWYTTGKVNIAYEAIDRWVDEKNKGGEAAILYSDNERDVKVTFADLKEQTNKFANVLTNLGIQKGDRVFYLSLEVRKCSSLLPESLKWAPLLARFLKRLWKKPSKTVCWTVKQSPLSPQSDKRAGLKRMNCTT